MVVITKDAAMFGVKCRLMYGTPSVSEVRSSTHHCAKEMVPLIFDSSSA